MYKPLVGNFGVVAEVQGTDKGEKYVPVVVFMYENSISVRYQQRKPLCAILLQPSNYFEYLYCCVKTTFSVAPLLFVQSCSLAPQPPSSSICVPTLPRIFLRCWSNSFYSLHQISVFPDIFMSIMLYHKYKYCKFICEFMPTNVES